MTIGHAIDELIELLRPMEEEMTTAQKRALRTLSAKGDKLRERRQDLRNAGLCSCKQHYRKSGSVVCWQCFANAPEAMRIAVKHGGREAIRDLIESAKRRGIQFETVSPDTTTDKQT